MVRRIVIKTCRGWSGTKRHTTDGTARIVDRRVLVTAHEMAYVTAHVTIYVTDLDELEVARHLDEEEQ